MKNNFIRNWTTRVSQLLFSEEGVTSIEYAVMLALVIGVCIAGITIFGTQTNESFTNSGDAISEAVGQ